MSRRTYQTFSGSGVELHLGSSSSDEHKIDFPTRFAHLVTELGGGYSHCRGYQSIRFVTLPATPQGIALAAELCRTYPGADRRSGQPGTVVLGRPSPASALNSAVHAFAPTGGDVDAVLARVFGATHGLALNAAMTTYDHEQRRMIDERADRPRRLREERERIIARLAEIDAELGAQL